MSARDIFPDVADQFSHYHVELQLRDLIVGGIPGDESVIRKWLEAKMELDETAFEELLEKTIAERNGPMSVQEKVDALAASPSAPSVNGFKRDADTDELYWETRCMKAAFKEFANSAYPGTDWPGKTDIGKGFRKGLQSTLEERVFIDGVGIGLGVKNGEVSSKPGEGRAWVEERVKHVMTPQGPRSSINRVQVVQRPLLSFEMKVRDDFLPWSAWGRIWQVGEEIGVGADRGRSDGRFDLVTLDKIS